MTRQSENPDAALRNASGTDVFVILSVTVLSLATGAWLLAQLGVAIWWAMTGALAIYATLLSVHIAARRSFAALDRAAVAHADAEIDWLKGPGEADAAPGGLPSDLSDVLAQGTATRRADSPLPGHWDIAPTPAGARAEPAHALPEPRAADPFAFRPRPAPSLERPHSEPRLELDFDPGDDDDLVERDLPDTEPLSFEASSPSERNVEVIQDLIKKLADELNGPPPSERAPDPAPETPAVAADTEAMIGRSVAALETTARSMRLPAAKPAATPEARVDIRQEIRQPAGSVPSWWPVAAADTDAQAAPATPASKPPALNPQLARIAEAVAAERIEVLLEPIHALAEGRTRHFEISVRLLTADGAALEQCDFSRAAHGTGLMPKIDAERMIRAARVARRLGERGRQGSVLSAIAGESLTDAQFLGTVASHKGADGRMNQVLSFAQCDVRTFSADHGEALNRLASAGFRFALEDVTDLDMDFGALQEMGFDFVKLDTPVFLEGLAAPGGRLPASDICRHLSEFGLTLIVGQIEDDWLLARILGFGVLFGKGTLFGGPKLVKPEVVARSAAAA